MSERAKKLHKTATSNLQLNFGWQLSQVRERRMVYVLRRNLNWQKSL